MKKLKSEQTLSSVKNKNLIKVAESKFAKAKQEVELPKQIKVNEISTVEQIQLQ